MERRAKAARIQSARPHRVPYPSGIGHTGIYLSDKVYISARNAEDRPGKDMQVADGVQITKIPDDRDATSRKVTANIPRAYQFDFHLDYHLPRGKTNMRVPQGSSLRIEMNARYEANGGNVEEATLPKNFTFILHHEDGDDPAQNTISSVVGGAQHYVFKSLPAGTYYLELKTDGTPNVLLMGTGSAELVD
jgi:hypothetical protein